MGKRSNYEKRPRGFYPTPWAAVEPLTGHLAPWAKIGEPCAGDGALCQHLYDAGYLINWASDIAPQDPRVLQRDALQLTAAELADVDVFVTNPPWPEPRKFGQPTMALLEHMISLKPTWALLPADFMHNVYAAELMGKCARIVAVGRVKWIAGSDHDGMDNCAWYEFYNFSNGGVLSFTPRRAKVAAS